MLRLEPERGAGRGRAEARARGARARGSSGVNWLGEDQRDGLTVKVRSLAQAGAGALRRRDASISTQPEYGVAPGQAAVLYEGDRVLGGGWIEETVAAELEAGLTAGERRRAAGPAASAPPSIAQACHFDCAAAQRQTASAGGDHRPAAPAPGRSALGRAAMLTA